MEVGQETLTDPLDKEGGADTILVTSIACSTRTASSARRKDPQTAPENDSATQSSHRFCCRFVTWALFRGRLAAAFDAAPRPALAGCHWISTLEKARPPGVPGRMTDHWPEAATVTTESRVQQAVWGCVAT